MTVNAAELSFADLEVAQTEHLKILAWMIRVELTRRSVGVRKKHT
ncbi:MAG: hypothetical protein ACREIB_01495 [Pseudomonadota bacterium]